MWRTPENDRTLAGAEGTMVRESVAHMVSMLEEEAEGLTGHWSFGVPVFDRLSWEQQLALLADVGEALLREDVSAPELSAMNEGAVGAIFGNLRQCLRSETDGYVFGDDEEFWRRLVLAAADEADAEEPAIEESELLEPDWEPARDPEKHLPNPLQREFPWVDDGPSDDDDYDELSQRIKGCDDRRSPECTDKEHWDGLIEGLEVRIFWDYDWLVDEGPFMDAAPESTLPARYQLGISDDYYTAIAPDPTDNELVTIRKRLSLLLGT